MQSVRASVPLLVSVYVLTESWDPYVPGGVPIAVYRDETEAWSRLAEEVALAASMTWEKDYLRHRRTRYEVMRDEASGYDVTAVPLL